MVEFRPALIFDLDGVLVDSERISLDVEIEILESAGLNIDRERYISELFGLNKRNYIEKLSDVYFEIKGESLPPGILQSIDRERWRRFEIELAAIEGVKSLLLEYTGEFCVASSSKMPSLRRKLEIAELLGLFGNRVFSSDQVLAGKPEPDVFLLAARELKFSPKDCLVIEDSVAGVKAGVAAGMRVIGFTGGSHAYPSLANQLLKSGANCVIDRISIIRELVGLRYFESSV